MRESLTLLLEDSVSVCSRGALMLFIFLISANCERRQFSGCQALWDNRVNLQLMPRVIFTALLTIFLSVLMASVNP